MCDLCDEYVEWICTGIYVYDLLECLCVGEKMLENMVVFDEVKYDFGYGLFLKCYMDKVMDVIEE